VCNINYAHALLCQSVVATVDIFSAVLLGPKIVYRDSCITDINYVFLRVMM
jgi:hypothetical protein